MSGVIKVAVLILGIVLCVNTTSLSQDGDGDGGAGVSDTGDDISGDAFDDYQEDYAEEVQYEESAEVAGNKADTTVRTVNTYNRSAYIYDNTSGILVGTAAGAAVGVPAASTASVVNNS